MASRKQLAAQIAEAVREFQDASDEIDEAAAALLGVNRTDLRCLGLLGRQGAVTAGQLAAEVGLTTGATTTAIDRLVRHGYVERVRDNRDRRRITIQITSEATSLIDKIWGPLGQEAQPLLLKRSTDQLQVILDFLREGARYQAQHVDRIRRQT